MTMMSMGMRMMMAMLRHGFIRDMIHLIYKNVNTHPLSLSLSGHTLFIAFIAHVKMVL